MADPHTHTDDDLIAMLQTDSDKAIDLIFRQYHKICHISAIRIVKDKHVAEDIVQDVFLELWKKRGRYVINTALKAYLRRSVVNRSLNYIRDLKIVFDEEDKIPNTSVREEGALKGLETEELGIKINEAINRLPERCRIVFTLSRFEEMTYQQIADQLNISIKTVENQISKALKQLRIAIKPYLE